MNINYAQMEHYLQQEANPDPFFVIAYTSEINKQAQKEKEMYKISVLRKYIAPHFSKIEQTELYSQLEVIFKTNGAKSEERFISEYAAMVLGGKGSHSYLNGPRPSSFEYVTHHMETYKNCCEEITKSINELSKHILGRVGLFLYSNRTNPQLRNQPVLITQSVSVNLPKNSAIFKIAMEHSYNVLKNFFSKPLFETPHRVNRYTFALNPIENAISFEVQAEII